MIGRSPTCQSASLFHQFKIAQPESSDRLRRQTATGHQRLASAVLLARPPRNLRQPSPRRHRHRLARPGHGRKWNLLIATGDRCTLIRIVGRPSPSPQGEGGVRGRCRSIPARQTPSDFDDYIPVGATSFHLKQPFTLKPGDTIHIIRPAPKPDRSPRHDRLAGYR